MTEQLAPKCATCRRPHRPDLPCWTGAYRRDKCEQVYRTKGRQCVICRVEGRTTRAVQVDHDQPRSRGGGDELDNLLPLCGTCNGRKGNRKYEAPPPRVIAGNGQPVSSRFR